MKYKLVASVILPATATPNGWVRTAKTIHISNRTPVWVVRIIDEWGKA